MPPADPDTHGPGSDHPGRRPRDHQHPGVGRPRRWAGGVSLRARLTLVFGAAMATLLVGLGAFTYLRLAGELLTGVDRNLGSRADALTAQLASTPPAADRPGADAGPGIQLGGGHRFVDPDEAFAQILDPAGRLLDSTPGASAAPLVDPRQADQISRAKRPAFITRHGGQPDDAMRLLVVPATVAGRPVIAVVGETLGDRRDALNHLLAIYAVTGPAGLALACLACWLLAGAALRPVEAIRARAAQLSHTTPTGRLPVPQTGDELARLTITLNDLLARLHAAVAREHRFVDDASHELRTPLAVLKAELDLSRTRPRTADELRTTIDTAAAQTDRLIILAEDLLVLARVRHGPTPARRTPTHLHTLLDTAVAPLRARAAHTGRTIRVVHQHDAHDPADACIDDPVVDVDPDQIARAVHNLANNALTHGAGDITITTRLEPGWLQIDVIDYGPGIPEHLLPTLFDPFTRATATLAVQALALTSATPNTAQPRTGLPPDSDPPVTRTGTGLGLAIVHAIATAHQGTAAVTNNPSGGARLRLRVRTSTDPDGTEINSVTDLA